MNIILRPLRIQVQTFQYTLQQRHTRMLQNTVFNNRLRCET